VKTRFYDLANELSQLGVWVRLHYVYPYPHVDEIIPLMSPTGLLPYLDIPFQHASPSILKAMRRPAHSENTLARLKQWRDICPDLKIRSTFIVGFPGETEQDFTQLLDFLDQAQLDRVGCFTYSPVEGAAANQLPGQVPEEVKQQRFEQFMALQNQISADKLRQAVDGEQTVIVDSLEEDKIIARTYGDAPEIDGLVIIEETNSNVKTGDFIDVKITGSDEYDLYGELSNGYG
jgi:ribosomal protein S12 methylthiotransferase